MTKATLHMPKVSDWELTTRHMTMDAINYAASDPTDPFALARAMTHIRIGMAQPGDYCADVTRDNDGNKVYSSVKRL